MRRQRGDLQARIVQLYFVRGWAVTRICCRYNLNRTVVANLLSEWRIRAVGAGYIQDVGPDATQALSQHLELVEEKEQ